MVLVYVEKIDGEIKKSSLEAIVFAASFNPEVNVLALGDISENEISELSKYGADTILIEKNYSDIQVKSNIIERVIQDKNIDLLVMPRSVDTDLIAGRVGIKVKAAVVTGVIEKPDTSQGFRVKKSIYTGKAYCNVDITTSKKILTLAKNTTELIETPKNSKVEQLDLGLVSGERVKVIKSEKASGDLLLTEADIVVSGGRGLKGPENWSIITDLAQVLGAATGCSKPVSDMDWRPHHEHVGQTGVKVSPNLYIAIGISGAIQHLAGVNSSKCIVVINKDSEAPFFKAADYGIVGDAFEVVPKLIEYIKNNKD